MKALRSTISSTLWILLTACQTYAFQPAMPMSLRGGVPISIPTSTPPTPTAFCPNDGSVSPPLQRFPGHQRLVDSSTRTASTTALQASPLVGAVSSPIGAIVVLASIVLVHEAGHYLAARYFGIAVQEFSVGVGPKITGFTAFGDEFSLRALPLGGYVRFPENYNATLVEELQQEAIAQAQAKRDKANQPSVANQVLNAVTLGWAERQRQAKLAAEEEAAAAMDDTKPWWQLAGRSRKNANDDLEVEPVEIPYDDNPNLLQNRPWTERAVVLSGGVIFNLLLSFSIFFGQINLGPGIPGAVFNPGVVVSQAPAPGVAAQGILQQGDVILNINGQALTTNPSPSFFESQKAINNLVNTIRSTKEGDPVTLSILRNDEPLDLITLKPEKRSASAAPSIGVMLTPNFVKAANLQSKNPIEAAKMAAQYTKFLTAETANGLWTALTQSFRSGGSGSPNVSGPIGLIKSGSEVVATKDLTAVLLFAAALSINLGVVNALPLPALDGGQLVFVLAEAITGRKVNQELQETVTGVAVLFLLFVTLTAAVGDISNIVSK